MSESKPSARVRIEFIVLLGGLLLFLFWTIRNCSRQQTDPPTAPTAESLRQQTTAELLDSMDRLRTPQATEDPAALQRDTATAVGLQIIRERVTPLFVTIDGLNMRQGPNRRFGIIDRLELYEEVFFLNEVTDSSETIKLGDTTTVAPWVKVKTRKGREGWVYGAGVHYYRKKLEGVE